MKTYNNIIKATCLAGLVALGFSSCKDQLELYPTDRVVEQNFWEDKNDLEGVRFGAYRQMAKTVSKFAVWGDLRSDAYSLNSVNHSDQGNRITYDDIMTGLPDSSMEVFDWGGVYTTINYCNKVLQHGAEVLAKDKQFTPSEWVQMRAEMVALRALNYFYLIRTFKDIPYTTKVVNADSEVEPFPLVNQLVVLDSIILDCESLVNYDKNGNAVGGQARNRFVNKKDTKGLITNTTIFAILADMYLWRASLHEGRYGIRTTKTFEMDTRGVQGVNPTYTVADDYNKSIACAQMSLKLLQQQNEEEEKVVGPSTSSIETFSYGLANCNMIKNKFDGVSSSNVPKLEALTAIFKTKNSRESIFELQYSQTDGIDNGIVNSLYGFSNGTHLSVSKEALDAIFEDGIAGEKEIGGGAWDTRVWVCCQNKLTTGSSSSSSSQGQASYYCMKYSLPEGTALTFDGQGANCELKSLKYTSGKYNNWIVYRMTDVMLIMAEAYACLSKSATDANAIQAKYIVNAINRRAYCNYKYNEKIPSTTIDTKANAQPAIGDLKVPGNAADAAEIMVFNERLIELLGEGKRWYDLVRYAERHAYAAGDPADVREEGVPNGQTGVKKMIDVFLQKSYQQFAPTLKNRFKNRYGLYSPIYYMEVKASDGAVEQNPVWNKSKYEQ